MKVDPNVATAFAVTLPAPATAGGVTVTLTSSDPSKVTVTPASVVVPEGASMPTTPPQVMGVGIGSATIMATAPGYVSGIGTVTVTAPTMAFAGAPLLIAMGVTRNLTLNLTSGQAPVGGLTVTLSSSDASKATVPPTVSFAPGATSTTVAVTGTGLGQATITASAPGIASATAMVSVMQPGAATASYGGGSADTINVTLTGASVAFAPVNLRVVSVTKVTAPPPNVIVLLPTNVLPTPYGTLPFGQGASRGFTFGATAGGLGVPFSFTVTYEADNMAPRTAVIDVPFPRSLNFSGSPLALNAGASGNLTLNLLGNQAPAGGLTVALSSSDPSRATVPAAVSFPAGASSVSVPVTGVAPGTATITASATVVGFPATATAIVNVTGAISVPPNTPVRLGQSAVFPVTLPAPAPAGGVTVTLTTNDISKVTVTPANVVIPQGATTPPTPPQLTGVGIGTVTIVAAAKGFTSGIGTATVTAPTMAFTGPPLAIVIGRTGNLTLSLTGGQAPAGGLTVNLSASDPSKVKVSVTVAFPPGATSVSVPVTAMAPGSVTVTASAPGMASATASITVTPPPTVTAFYHPNAVDFIDVGLANTSSVTAVNLQVVSITKVTAAAPNVLVVAPGVIIPRRYGTVAGGQGAMQSFGFTATAGSIFVPFSFTITYQADNMPPQTAVIDVPFPRAMSFSGSPLTIDTGATGNLTLNLTGNQAPAGGLTVTLSSSDPSRATVPSTVSFAPGGTSVTVPVTGLAPGTAVITASVPFLVNQPATATATVNVAGGAIRVSSATSVTLGLAVGFAVTLPGPAPAGGITVTLSSSDASKVTVTPASVVIPPGATTSNIQPQVAGVGIGSATVTATSPGYTPAAGTVTVTGPPTVVPSYHPNSDETIDVVLTNTSSVTAVNVQLVSITNVTAAAPNVIAVTPGWPIPRMYGTLVSGQGVLQSFRFRATAGSLGVPFSFTITYQADNMPPQTAVIDVPFPRAMSFSGSPLTINTGATGNLTLNLTGNQAPAGGLTVTLSSSDRSRAMVPSTVSFQPGGTRVTVPVTGLAPGTAVIMASVPFLVNQPATATATVNVTLGRPGPRPQDPRAPESR